MFAVHCDCLQPLAPTAAAAGQVSEQMRNDKIDMKLRGRTRTGVWWLMAGEMYCLKKSWGKLTSGVGLVTSDTGGAKAQAGSDLLCRKG